MNQLQRKRAKRFAAFLINKVRAKQFDIDRVCEIMNGDNEDPLKGLTGACGTVACAIGHLPVYNPKRFRFIGNASYFEVLDTETRSKDYINIAVNYFGFTEDEADWLFTPWGYEEYKRVTPKTVARRILGLLNKNDKIVKEFKVYSPGEK